MTSLPTAFLSHGLPRIALERGPWANALRMWAAELNPRAVIVASSQWRTEIPSFTGARRPGIEHDFDQEPLELYALGYDAPGDPALALTALSLLGDADIKGTIEPRRRLDHGAWIPLRTLFPDAQVPIVEMSLPAHGRPEDLGRLGLALAPLREDGVLLIGSGCMVHSTEPRVTEDPAPWAVSFDRWLDERLRLGEMAASFAYDREPHAERAVPCPGELAPLFFAWGAADGGAARTICEGWQMGSVSLRSVSFAA